MQTFGARLHVFRLLRNHPFPSSESRANQRSAGASDGSLACFLKDEHGICVFQNLAVYGIVFAVLNLHVPAVFLQVPWLYCLAVAVLTISAPAVSRHFFEKPLNDLKRHFPCTAPRKVTQAVEEKIQVAGGG